MTDPRAQASPAGAECAVLYLERFGNDPYFSATFLRSMERFSAGAPFDYIHVLKGFPKGAFSAPLRALTTRRDARVQVRWVPDDQLPTGALLPVIRELPHDKILLFMSWSRILAPNWMRYFLKAFEDENVGIAGATGGYERWNYRDLSLPFPNVSIRTTGFMMRRTQYCELAQNITTRDQELAFESGADSLTKQIMRRGLRPVVVDRNGKIWEVPDWGMSRTFRSGHQERLLFADNRTYDYDRSKDSRRARLAQINWGDEANPPANPLWRRLWADAKWRFLGR